MKRNETKWFEMDRTANGIKKIEQNEHEMMIIYIKRTENRAAIITRNALNCMMMSLWDILLTAVHFLFVSTHPSRCDKDFIACERNAEIFSSRNDTNDNIIEHYSNRLFCHSEFESYRKWHKMCKKTDYARFLSFPSF